MPAAATETTPRLYVNLSRINVGQPLALSELERCTQSSARGKHAAVSQISSPRSTDINADLQIARLNGGSLPAEAPDTITLCPQILADTPSSAASRAQTRQVNGPWVPNHPQ